VKNKPKRFDHFSSSSLSLDHFPFLFFSSLFVMIQFPIFAFNETFFSISQMFCVPGFFEMRVEEEISCLLCTKVRRPLYDSILLFIFFFVFLFATKSFLVHFRLVIFMSTFLSLHPTQDTNVAQTKTQLSKRLFLLFMRSFFREKGKESHRTSRRIGKTKQILSFHFFSFLLFFFYSFSLFFFCLIAKRTCSW